MARAWSVAPQNSPKPSRHMGPQQGPETEAHLAASALETSPADRALQASRGLASERQRQVREPSAVTLFWKGGGYFQHDGLAGPQLSPGNAGPS